MSSKSVRTRSFLHREFAGRLRAEIEQGRFKPGDLIPSERELVEQFAISRTTVRRALAALTAEGLLTSAPGTGTFVAERARAASARAPSHQLGWVLDMAEAPLDSPYYSKIFRSMQETAAAEHYHFAFCPLRGGGRLMTGKLIRERNLDGLVFIGSMDEKLVLEAHRLKVPLVVVDDLPARNDITAVLPDNRNGAVTATRHLIGLGHRRIAFFGLKDDDRVSAERYEGYREAMAAAGLRALPPVAARGPFSVAAGAATVRQVLTQRQRPTALVAMNDELAIGALQGIREHGKLGVPRDLSITGFDDIDWAAHTDPPLTTVRIDKEEIGRLAVRFLLDQIRGKDNLRARVLTPVELIVRSSTAVRPG